MAASDVAQLATAVAAVLAGDAEQVPAIADAQQDQLRAATLGSDLVLTTDAVVVLLRRYRSGEFDGTTVQAWASFVRRGYIALRSLGPIEPLSIEYELAYPDAIVDALARLDEIGDLIDGTVGDAEVGILLGGLGVDP